MTDSLYGVVQQGVFFYACGYGLSGLAVSFQQFLQRSAVGCDKFLSQFTALDLDGDMIVVRADEGAAEIVKVRVGVAGLLDLAAVDAKLLPNLWIMRFFDWRVRNTSRSMQR